MKVALITSITGQDGSYLAELLLEKNLLILNKNNTDFKLNNNYHKIIALEKSYSLHYYSPPY